jgi:hypothetical protein
MSIDALPVAPSQTDSVTDFDLNAFAFVAALQAFRTQTNSTADEVQNNADITAALALSMALPNYAGTSTTSLLIGLGEKSFVTQSGKSWVAGQIVVASSGVNYMKGTITSYTSTTLVVNVTRIVGSGTLASWTIGLGYDSLGLSPRATRIDVASVAGVVDLTANAPDTDDIKFTGNNAMTGFTAAVGRVFRFVVATGATPSFVNGANLITQRGTNIQLAGGDSGSLRVLAGGVVEVLSFVPAVVTSVQVPVRQTVLSGPVDSNGFAAFGGSTGSTTVTAAGTLVATAANGLINRVGTIVNPSWTGLTASAYLYLDIASDGTCTTGSISQMPVYQWGGTYSTTNGKFTFNIQEMTGKVGNGSTAVQTYRVFVGEVAAAGTVSAITWYALNGRYQSADTAFTYSSSVVLNHNIGDSNVEIIGELVCVTAEAGYTPGQVIQLPSPSFETNARGTSWVQSSHKTVTFYIPFSILSVNTSSSYFGVTPANWKLRVTAKRKAW